LTAVLIPCEPSNMTLAVPYADAFQPSDGAKLPRRADPPPSFLLLAQPFLLHEIGPFLPIDESPFQARPRTFVCPTSRSELSSLHPLRHCSSELYHAVPETSKVAFVMHLHRLHVLRASTYSTATFPTPNRLSIECSLS